MSTSTSQTFLLPDLGEGLTEAEIVRWLVAVDDVIAVDQAMVEVETAKSVVELPSPYAGRVSVLHAAEGDMVLVGRPLIAINVDIPSEADTYREEERAGSGNVLIGYGTGTGTGSSEAGHRRRRPRPATKNNPTVRPTEPQAQSGPHRAALLTISPLVRALARDHGLDLRTIAPTGNGGVVTRADVEAAIKATNSAASVAARSSSAERRTPLTPFRRAVSATLSRSRSEIPEATVWVDVDATELWQLRQNTRTSNDSGPGLLAYIARFTVAALRQYPVFNGRVDTDRNELVELPSINLGLAVQTDRGLVVPAVMAAEALTTSQLDEQIRSVTRTALEGCSTHDALSAGTFTLNNYGSLRVDGSAAIINHPQVAILGFGRILDRAWVVEGQVAVRKVVQMSFVFDHRVSDGGAAAGFMRSVADAIEDPASAIARL